MNAGIANAIAQLLGATFLLGMILRWIYRVINRNKVFVWSYRNHNERELGICGTCIGTANSYQQLDELSLDSPSVYLGYTNFLTKKPISYGGMMARWKEEPWLTMAEKGEI
ncbi:hypothetical protein ACFL0C_00605 [Patescibacteria group bacterium]